jgi:hypothetical protein
MAERVDDEDGEFEDARARSWADMAVMRTE